MIPQAVHANASSPAHEREDISVRAVAYVGLGVGLLIVFLLVFIVWILGIFSHHSPIIVSKDIIPGQKSFPQTTVTPRLQIASRHDYEAYLRDQNKVLSTYKINPDGSAQIPIEDAMKILLKDGLPTWHQAGEKHE